MSRNVVFVAINVDDVRYHGCALDSGEALALRCRATLKGLLTELEKFEGYFTQA